MLANALEIHQYFVMSDGELFRKLASGRASRVAVAGRHGTYVQLQGRRVSAADVAWTLHYGNWPMFPITLLRATDGFALHNLMPCRVRRLRCTLTAVPGGFRHPLSKAGFLTRGAAERDWEMCARTEYMADLPFVLQLEAEMRTRIAAATPEDRGVVLPRAKKALPTIMVRKPNGTAIRPAKLCPPPIEGHKWHYHEKEWLSVPIAVHPSDDYRVRCAAVKRGAVAFSFDSASQTTREVPKTA